MKLILKGYIPGNTNNGNGSVRGSWIFEQADVAALTFINELFLSDMPDTLAVTNSADLKFISPAFPHNYFEAWGELESISPGCISILVTIKYRHAKSKEYTNCLTGTVGFTLINKDRKVVRVPKEVINAVKG
jgi:acyl-CoA thioesterase FadM